MKLAVMQPYLFPYIGYFQLINAVDKFVIFDDVTYIKKGWINRNYILINKQKALFTVPLKNAGQNSLIKGIEISEDIKWRDKFLKTVELNYKKSPFFTETFEIIKQIITLDEKFISRMIAGSFRIIGEKLNINTEIIESSAIYDSADLKGQQKVLNICKQEKATKYINPIGGTQLYESELFEENNIKLSFLKTNPLIYKQHENEFVPNLSIIDVLMFNGFAETQNFLSEYTLN